MKKLLSLLSISTLTAGLPTPLLANVPLGRDIDKTTAQLIRNKRENDKIYNFEIKNLQKVRFVISKQKNNITRVNILKMDNINLNEKLPELKNLENLSFLFTQELQNNQSKQDKIKQLITTHGQEIKKINDAKLWVIEKKVTIKAQGTNLKDFEYGNYKVNYQLNSTNNLEIEIEKDSADNLEWVKLQLDPFVVENIKNVTQDEINTYKTKLLNTVKSQVEKYVPDVVENTDYVINTNNLVAGDWTTSKDVTVQAVNSSTKLLNFTTATIPVQQKYHPETLVPTSEPTPDNKDEDSKLWIIGVVVGVLGLGGIVYLLFRKFVFNKYILPKIYARRQQKVVEQWKRDDREEAEELARKQKQNSTNDNFKFLNDKELLRLTGIKQNTFNKMLDILKEAEAKQKKISGRPNKLSLKNRLLMALSYWQGSRTYFHLGKSYDISESSCYRNIKWIEDTLIKHPNFQQLTGQKSLLKDYFKDKTVIIDVTEAPFQRQTEKDIAQMKADEKAEQEKKQIT